MSRSVAVIALLLAAAFAHLGVSRPARQRAMELGQEEGRLHRLRRQQRQILTEVEGRARRLEAARALVAGAAALDRDRAPSGVRAALVGLLADRSLDDVRLAVRPAVAPAVARFELSAAAPTTGEALDLISSLTDAGDGRVVTDVSLTVDSTGGRRLRVQGFRLAGGGRPASEVNPSAPAEPSLP